MNVEFTTYDIQTMSKDVESFTRCKIVQKMSSIGIRCQLSVTTFNTVSFFLAYLAHDFRIITSNVIICYQNV